MLGQHFLLMFWQLASNVPYIYFRAPHQFLIYERIEAYQAFFFCVIFRNDSFLLCKIISTNIYLDTSPTRAIIITTTYKKHKVFFYFWRVSVETWCVFSLFSAEIFWGFTSRVFPWQEQKAVRTTRGTRLAAHRHHLRQWRQVLSWFLWEVLVSHSHLLLFPGVKMQVHLSQYIVLLVWNQP